MHTNHPAADLPQMNIIKPIPSYLILAQKEKCTGLCNEDDGLCLKENDHDEGSKMLMTRARSHGQSFQVRLRKTEGENGLAAVCGETLNKGRLRGRGGQNP